MPITDQRGIPMATKPGMLGRVLSANENVLVFQWGYYLHSSPLKINTANLLALFLIDIVVTTTKFVRVAVCAGCVSLTLLGCAGGCKFHSVGLCFWDNLYSYDSSVWIFVWGFSLINLTNRYI